MSKVKDMAGQTFGKLYIIKRDGSKNGCATWLCQCECGKQIIAKGSELRKGNITSCGCRKLKQNLQLIGQKINYLTVLEQTDLRTNDGSILWKCQCDCGKIINIPTTKLKNKTAKSCGCEGIKKFIENNKKRIIDLSNQRFGNLIALEDSHQRSSDKQVIWKCICDCGKETFVRSGDLQSGNTKSCGCKRTSSYGEEKIQKILELNNIRYEKEKTFSNCRFIDTNHLARFDFYLPDYNTIIEYDGRQHYIQGNGNFDNKEKFEQTKERDLFKESWCKINHINIIRIPYTHYDNIGIEDLIPETSIFLLP